MPFLVRLTPDEVADRLSSFRRRYNDDWDRWVRHADADNADDEFRLVMRRWQACRKRKGVKGDYAAIQQAFGAAPTLQHVTLRGLATPSLPVIEDFRSMWQVLSQAICVAPAEGVAISKAIMLLTHGRIGPAFDRFVREKYKLAPIRTASELVAAYGTVARDLRNAEAKWGGPIESLCPEACCNVAGAVGRLVDMVAGPSDSGDARDAVPGCPFCSPSLDRVLIECETAVAILDAFPVSDGHALVVPRRHVSSLFDLTAKEQAAAWSLMAEVRQLFIERHDPAGFNIGVNDGRAAGQTIDHAHIHVIPRYDGDVPDPRGGVRCVVPDRARYWTD